VVSFFLNGRLIQFKMKALKNILTGILICIAFLSFGQGTMLEVQLSKDTVYFGNQVKVTFVASNISGSFVPPSFDGFNVVNGPYTSSSYSFINGSESRKTTYIYVLEPITIGKLTIGKATYKSADKELSSNEIKIYVKANPEGIKESVEKNEQKRSNDFFGGFGSMEDFFNSPDLKPFSTQPQEAPIKATKPKYKFKTEKL